MAPGRSGSSTRSAIVLLLTLVVVVAVLIFISAQKPSENGSGFTVVSTVREKVDLKAMYKEAGTPAMASSAQAVSPTPVNISSKESKKEVVRKPVAKTTAKKKAVKKRVAAVAPVKKTVKKLDKNLPTREEIKAAMPGGEKPWATNVASFTKESAAKALAAKLQKSGFNAYVTPFSKGSVQWYRVRVGYFLSRADAVKFGNDLGVELRLPSKPWPVRPQWEEITAHIKK